MTEGSEATPEPPEGAVPHRELRDPAALRALAHPLRLQLLEQLMQHATATATDLAERVGESNANCSWHLRVLARHGFIEEAPGGKGRQRPWRLVRASQGFSRFDEESPELAMAASAAQDVLYDQAVEAFRRWRQVRHLDAKEWRDAAPESLNWTYLTAEELSTLRAELDALHERHLHLERVDPANRPAGARLVRIVTYAVPAGPEGETKGEA